MRRLAGNNDRVTGPAAATATAGSAPSLASTRLAGSNRPLWQRYCFTLGLVAIGTGASLVLHGESDLGNVVAIYLLGVMVAAVLFGRGPAVLASALGAIAFDFLFLPPRFSLVPEQARHLLTFVIMLTVALTVSALAARLRDELQQTAALYGLARDLARAGDASAVASVVDGHVHDVFGGHVVLLVLDEHRELRPIGPLPDGFDGAEHLAARALLPRAGEAPALGAARGVYLPLTALRGVFGVFGMLPMAPPPPRHYLEAFANQTALALERTLLAEAAQHSAIAIEQERLRSTLLSSVSHDLRTPIAAIIGAASALLRQEPLDAATRTGLLEAIHHEGNRLEQLVRNLLYMTRLEAGTVQLRCDWTPIEDVVGAVLTRLEDALSDRAVTTELQPDLPPVPMDGLLIEQVMLNLLENVLRYTPPGSPVTLAVRADGEYVRIEVADRGPGIAEANLERIFEKFHNSSLAGSSGLGLAICRAIVSLHGGAIAAQNRPDGGASFVVTLPMCPPTSLPPLSMSATRGS